MSIGQMIYNRRKELHLTLEEVGKAVGVSKSTVKKWEDGYISNMKRDKIALLAKVLDINPVSLVTDDNVLSIYLPSAVSEKLEIYLDSIFLPSDERKEIAKRVISKSEALTAVGLQKLEERVDELLLINGDYVREDYRDINEKIIDINKREATKE